MFGLGHFYSPWAFLVQIFAIVHFVRRRPENYWFYVIFFGSWPGAAVYIVAEVLPDLGLLRGVYQGFGRRSRIKIVETQILIIRLRPITKSWANSTKIWGNLRRREKLSLTR